MIPRTLTASRIRGIGSKNVVRTLTTSTSNLNQTKRIKTTIIKTTTINHYQHHSFHNNLNRINRREFSSSVNLNGKLIKPFLLADIGEGITECEIVKWLVEQDQIIEEFDPVVEVMSDKATVEITSPFSGKITFMNGLVGDVIKVGGILCEVETEDGLESALPSTSTVEPIKTPTTTTSIGEISMEVPSISGEIPPISASIPTSSTRSMRDVIATPSTRRIARESLVNLQDVEGTGKDGRVTKSDVLSFVSNGSNSSTSIPTSSTSSTSSASATTHVLSSSPSKLSTSTSSNISTPSNNITTESTILPLSPLRKAMFKAMTSTLQIPHFSYSETIDITLLERFRISLNKNIPLRFKKTLTEKEEFEFNRLIEFTGTSGEESRVELEERYDRLTLLPLLIKALSISMSTNPLFTCSLSTTSSEPQLIHHKPHNISLALSSPTGGLFTPLLPSVENSSPFKLASQISSLQNRANISSPPKFPSWSKGNGTITLSNVGVIGGRFTHPIIPPTGQLCIGAIGKSRIVPTYVASEVGLARSIALEGGSGEMLRIEPRLMMDVTFSADHRIVEGVELAKLVEGWKKIIEEPSLLIGLGR